MSAGADPTYKAVGRIVTMLRPKSERMSAAHLVEVKPQRVCDRHTDSRELSGRTVTAVPSKAFAERGVDLADGDMVVLLVRPDDPEWHARIIGRCAPNRREES